MAAPSGRVYSNYDLAYSRRPEIKHRHAEQVAARRLARKEFGAKAIEGKDIDHIRALVAGGTTTPRNIRIRSIHSNRGDKTFYN
jgi:hypothetical protein